MHTINDALPTEKFLELKKQIVSDNFQWNFLPFTSNKIYPDGRDYQLNHPVFFDGKIQSPLFEELSKLLMNALSSTGNEDLVINKFLLIKINALTNVGVGLCSRPILYHTTPHKTGILFLNDCDSKIILFKDKYEKQFNLNPVDFAEKILLHDYRELSMIEPSDNKIIVFDGFHYHTSCTPTNCKMFPSIQFTFL